MSNKQNDIFYETAMENAENNLKEAKEKLKNVFDMVGIEYEEQPESALFDDWKNGWIN